MEPQKTETKKEASVVSGYDSPWQAIRHPIFSKIKLGIGVSLGVFGFISLLLLPIATKEQAKGTLIIGPFLIIVGFYLTYNSLKSHKGNTANTLPNIDAQTNAELKKETSPVLENNSPRQSILKNMPEGLNLFFRTIGIMLGALICYMLFAQISSSFMFSYPLLSGNDYSYSPFIFFLAVNLYLLYLSSKRRGMIGAILFLIIEWILFFFLYLGLTWKMGSATIYLKVRPFFV